MKAAAGENILLIAAGEQAASCARPGGVYRRAGARGGCGQVCTHSTSIIVLGGTGAGGRGGQLCTHGANIVVLGGAGAGGRSGQV